MYQSIDLPAFRTAAAPTGRNSAFRLPGVPGSVKLIGGVALSVAVLMLVLTVITSTAYHNADLRALVSDPTCATPCWAGIVPGVTSAAEAIAALENHPWIAQVQPSLGKISFWWNGQQPALFDDTGRAFHGRLELGLIDGVERVVSIVLATRALLGDVQLTLGQPDALTLFAVAASETTRAGVVHVGEYTTRGITAFNLLSCGLDVADFWSTSTFIAFGTPTLAFAGERYDSSVYALPAGFFADHGPVCA